MREQKSLNYHELIPHLPTKERKKVVSEFEKRHSHFWDSVNIQSASKIIAMMIGAGAVSALGLLDGEANSRILWFLVGTLPALPISNFVRRLVRSKNESKFLEFFTEAFGGGSEADETGANIEPVEQSVPPKSDRAGG